MKSDHEYQYHPDVQEDDKIVGKILTRRQALALSGLMGMATLVGCGGGGGGGNSTSGSAPVITTQPVSQTAAVGTSVSFTVVATGSGLSYQWYKGSTAITGATSATYTISSVVAGNAGSFYVVVTNSAGHANSTNATLTVSTTIVAPSITTQPSSATVVAGNAASFSVVATGTNLTYQWYKDGTAISGATSATYTIASTTPSSEGDFHVVVSNTAGTATSNTATLTVTVSLPSITTQPTSQTVAQGTSATFSVVASGYGLSYQWYKDGSQISGATSASYTIASTTTSDAGTYHVVVSNSAGSKTSNDATLTVGTGIDLVATPQVTEGPFFVDEGLNRSNLLSGTSRSTVTGGFPLTLVFTLYSLNGTTGTPLAGAHVDLWHADTIGTYSDEASSGLQSENTSGQTWLRGYQVTDANGQATFQTIHPGWYVGRTPHLHLKIRTYNASNNLTHEFTTQMFFTETRNTSVLAGSIYQHGTRTVFNSNDNIYSVLQSDGTAVGTHLMLNLANTSSSETGTFALAFVFS